MIESIFILLQMTYIWQDITRSPPPVVSVCKRGCLLFGIISYRFVHFLGNLNFNITKSRRASDSLNPTLLNNQIPRSEIFQSKDFQSIKLHRIIIIFLVMMMVSGFISSVFVRIIFTSGIQGG